MNSRAAKMLQELQELLLILRSVGVSLFMPVNLIFFGVFLGVGGRGGVWVRQTLNQTSHSSAVPCRVQRQQSLTVTMGMNGRSGVRNSRREEREEAATATEASTHPSPPLLPEIRTSTTCCSIKLRLNSQVLNGFASNVQNRPKNGRNENLRGYNFVLKIESTRT